MEELAFIDRDREAQRNFNRNNNFNNNRSSRPAFQQQGAGFFKQTNLATQQSPDSTPAVATGSNLEAL